MADPFISPAMAQTIADAQSRAFATEMVLGDADGSALMIVLERDSDEDGEPTLLPAQHVLLTMAKREAARSQANATSFMGADGQLEKQGTFDVQKGDRFRLPANPPATRGQPGLITMVMPAEGGVTRAMFTLQG